MLIPIIWQNVNRRALSLELAVIWVLGAGLLIMQNY